MKRLTLICSALLAFGLVACSDTTTTNIPPPCTPSLWANNTIPPCTVPVNFSVDDTANKAFKNGGDILWKGSFQYDAPHRIAYKDSSWGGPYVPLYDDGPWTGWVDTSVTPAVTRYGHEPKGSFAKDNIWGATVFVYPPATGTDTWEYGLVDNLYEIFHGNGWMWKGANGTFTVAANATAPVDALGMTIAKFGDVDFRLELDSANLAVKAPPFTTATSVKVKSSIWGWGEYPLVSVGGGIYSLTLSQNFGPGTQFPHTGLLKSADKPEFVFVLDGAEYKVSSVPPTTGVKAFTKAAAAGSLWVEQTVVNLVSNGNTSITVP